MANDTQISKTLSFWLRHKPEAAGLTLSAEGWADVDLVLQALSAQGLPSDRERLLQVVETNGELKAEW